MKRANPCLALIFLLPFVACAPVIAEPATPTPEIFIARTRAIPAQVVLSGLRLHVVETVLDVHFPAGCSGTEPLCAEAPPSFRFLSVTLAPVEATPNDALDYKHLPAGIQINVAQTSPAPFTGRLTYAPEAQQLTLGFEVPNEAEVFGLQWPEAAEIPLTPRTLR